MSATTMQPNRLKAACLAVLERNKQCNTDATPAKKACNSEAINHPQKLHAVSAVADPQIIIREVLAELDQAGPWPRDYYASLPTATLERLRALLLAVEQAALAEDVQATAGALAEYRAELLRHLH